MSSNSFKRRIKRKAIQWLLTQINTETVRENCLRLRLSTGATLTPEAVVQNNRGNPDCITVGAHSYIQGRLMTHAHGGKITIGDWSFLGHRSEVWSMDSVSIGNRVLISYGVSIHDHTAHSRNPVERHAHFQKIMNSGHPQNPEDLGEVKTAPIVIEDDVWINFGATILRGVRIGRGSIIGAGAMVAENVPPGMLYLCKVNPVMVPLEL